MSVKTEQISGILQLSALSTRKIEPHERYSSEAFARRPLRGYLAESGNNTIFTVNST